MLGKLWDEQRPNVVWAIFSLIFATIITAMKEWFRSTTWQQIAIIAMAWFPFLVFSLWIIYRHNSKSIHLKTATNPKRRAASLVKKMGPFLAQVQKSGDMVTLSNPNLLDAVSRSNDWQSEYVSKWYPQIKSVINDAIDAGMPLSSSLSLNKSLLDHPTNYLGLCDIVRGLSELSVATLPKTGKPIRIVPTVVLLIALGMAVFLFIKSGPLSKDLENTYPYPMFQVALSGMRPMDPRLNNGFNFAVDYIIGNKSSNKALEFKDFLQLESIRPGVWVVDFTNKNAKIYV